MSIVRLLLLPAPGIDTYTGVAIFSRHFTVYRPGNGDSGAIAEVTSHWGTLPENICSDKARANRHGMSYHFAA
jgi:hypothetical protein